MALNPNHQYKYKIKLSFWSVSWQFNDTPFILPRLGIQNNIFKIFADTELLIKVIDEQTSSVVTIHQRSSTIYTCPSERSPSKMNPGFSVICTFCRLFVLCTFFLLAITLSDLLRSLFIHKNY